MVEGRFTGGQPYLRLGQGPPLLMATGLLPRSGNPVGLQRHLTIAGAAPFAAHFTVYVVNRRTGLPPGTSMSDLAGHLAEAVRHDLGGSALVHGTSTGGSVALQLAVDHPELVRRMVVASAACRLGPVAQRGQAEFARRVEAGDRRGAWAPMIEPGMPRPMRPLALAAAWLFGPRLLPADSSDLLRTIAAEDAFDVEAALGRVQAATLVLGGGADPFYSEDLFRRTATGIPQGRAMVFPRRGHVGAASSRTAVAAALAFLRHPVRPSTIDATEGLL